MKNRYNYCVVLSVYVIKILHLFRQYVFSKIESHLRMIFDNHNILLFVLGKSSGNPNLAVVSKNMSVPTVTLVTKPQVPSVVPRPSFRISTGILYYVKGWFLLYR
jgi:hypothetical protein